MSAPQNPFEIAEVDVRGVPLHVFRYAPPSLRAIWDASALHGPNEYLVYGDERITFAQAHQQVAALAERLAGVHGVRKGDRVAIAMRNYPEWALAFWATVSLGAVAVPLNAWWTGPELEYGLRDSGAVVLFADDERAERVRDLLAGTAVRAVVLARTARKLPNSESFKDAVARAGLAAPLPQVAIDPEDDASIMYTSGTTGRPKGAVATHRNFTAHLMNLVYRTMQLAASLPAPTAPPAPPVTLLTFPLFHVGGLQSFLMPFTANGGKVVLMYKWDPAEAVDLVERERVTSVAGVPTTLFQLLEEASAQGRALPTLNGVASGATLVPPELVRRIDKQLASRAAPTNGYGLTETSGAAIANGGPDYLARPDSVGRPISPCIRVRIVRADGGDAGVEEVGEIWLQGPTIVRGYFGLDDATRAAFGGGWFRTGDLGKMDAEGYVYVVDRLKDMIIRGGENIYAAEVEAALYEHPDITEAAIIGLPHERLGEEVGAVVRTRAGSSLEAADVQKHVAERLAAFKVPSRVWIVDTELPRNAAGKVLKRELRQALTGAR
jgi:long-chain acyl-CoA synthetase